MSTTSLKNLSPAAMLFYDLIQDEAFNECGPLGFRDAIALSMRAVARRFDSMMGDYGTNGAEVLQAVPVALEAIRAAVASNGWSEPRPTDYIRALENDAAIFEHGYPDEPYAYPSEILQLFEEAEECEASAKANHADAAAAYTAAFKRFCARAAVWSICRAAEDCSGAEGFAVLYLIHRAGELSALEAVDELIGGNAPERVQLTRGEDGREVVGYQIEISPNNFCGISFGESFHRYGGVSGVSNTDVYAERIGETEHRILCRLGVDLGLPRAMYF